MYFEWITDAYYPMYCTAIKPFQKRFPLHEQRESPS